MMKAVSSLTNNPLSLPQGGTTNIFGASSHSLKSSTNIGCQGLLYCLDEKTKKFVSIYHLLDNDNLIAKETPMLPGSFDRASLTANPSAARELYRIPLRFTILETIKKPANNSFAIGFAISQGKGNKKWEFFLQTKDDYYGLWHESLKMFCFQIDHTERYMEEQVLRTKANIQIKLVRNIMDQRLYVGKYVSKEYFVKHPIRLTLAKNEIKYLQECQHSRIIRLHEFFSDEKYLVLILEYMRGGTLYEKIATKRRYTEEDVAKIMKDLLEGLVFIHSRGIIHRDVKLENIFLPEHANDTQVKLGDFDIAAEVNEVDQNKQCGTAGYMAPEVFFKSYGGYSPKTDIYSSGIVFYILLTGQSPFRGSSYDAIYAKNKAGDIDFKVPRLKSVSQEAINLLQKMLLRPQYQRPTATEALLHPFIKKFCPDIIPFATTMTDGKTGRDGMLSREEGKTAKNDPVQGGFSDHLNEQNNEPTIKSGNSDLSRSSSLNKAPKKQKEQQSPKTFSKFKTMKGVRPEPPLKIIKGPQQTKPQKDEESKKGIEQNDSDSRINVQIAVSRTHRTIQKKEDLTSNRNSALEQMSRTSTPFTKSLYLAKPVSPERARKSTDTRPHQENPWEYLSMDDSGVHRAPYENMAALMQLPKKFIAHIRQKRQNQKSFH